MEKCQGCEYFKDGECGSSSCTFIEKGNEANKIKYVIGIMSGKGGVGKSSVTAMMANVLKNNNYKVGILDGDITGPSIAKMFGVRGPARNVEGGIQPVITENGISIMSMNLLLPNETDPVIWRGPIVSGVIKQFWNDVIWGELDYLLVDFPPGTGDVALTAMQSLPLNGVVMVASPQNLVHMIVKKGIKMAEGMKIPIIGLIENMSYVQPPGLDKPYYLFGEGKTEEVANELGLNFLGRIPIEREFVDLMDSGEIYKYKHSAFEKLIEHLLDIIKVSIY
ncbi:Mrp/NBP35 family ATP-binding protein [Alkaliphilus peptidifermentans]|uniref:Iron-sulfur cluster carrier protein n=1 Tax=Alkaliphilus peptidifermentans DSM 18978 TaxID=1120976 RepID=A0A1G5IZV7_9FIRM|nr:Mrp/NBP35 family ATP-binding protein [Alkaliphilus peptidifermentans]SCY81444.1 Chromosome partitioning ATPase, Mrp family, contains Fe-S cluster [Alkaliphilus peptidifermentans DSM 18978]